MKQTIGWTLPVMLVLLCLGASINSCRLSRDLALQLSSVRAQSLRTEQTVHELTELVEKLKQDQVEGNEKLQADLLALETPWTTSADGKLQVKLTVERGLNKPGEAMTVWFEAKNVHDQPLTIDSPSLFDPWDIHLSHEGQRVGYYGPIPCPAPPRPVPLQPGEVARFDLQLTLQNFAALANAGLFEVQYRYQSASPGHWQGSIGPLKTRWVNR